MTFPEAEEMGILAVNTANREIHPGMAACYFEPHWYVAYAHVNHEKRVAEQLEERSIEHFLPLYASVRRWKVRRVRLEMPLFPGYVFVRLALRDRLKILQIPSVANLVSFGGQPARLSDADVQALQNCVVHGHSLEPHPYMQIGRRVRVVSGPLQGLEGIILRRKNKTRFILSFDLIMRSVAVEMDEADLAAAD